MKKYLLLALIALTLVGCCNDCATAYEKHPSKCSDGTHYSWSYYDKMYVMNTEEPYCLSPEGTK